MKKITTLVGVKILLVIAVVLFGGVFAWQYFSAKLKSVTPLPMNQKQQIISQKPNPVAGWKTLTNTQFNFSLNYPDNWSIFNYIPGTAYSVDISPSEKSPEMITLEIFNNDKNYSLRDWINNYLKEGSTGPEFTNAKNVSIDGASGLEGSYSSGGNDQVDDTIFFLNNSMVYEIDKVYSPIQLALANGVKYPADYDTIFRGVISSFKFTKPSAGLSLNDINNATYPLGGSLGEPIAAKFSNGGYKLNNGTDTFGADIDAKHTAFGDLNGDGKNDAVVIMTTDYYQGAGQNSSLFIMLDQNGKPTYADNYFLGNQVTVNSVSINNGIIMVNINDKYINYPSRTIYFQLSGNKLVEVNTDISYWTTYSGVISGEPISDYSIKCPSDFSADEDQSNNTIWFYGPNGDAGLRIVSGIESSTNNCNTDFSNGTNFIINGINFTKGDASSKFGKGTVNFADEYCAVRYGFVYRIQPFIFVQREPDTATRSDLENNSTLNNMISSFKFDFKCGPSTSYLNCPPIPIN